MGRNTPLIDKLNEYLAMYVVLDYYPMSNVPSGRGMRRFYSIGLELQENNIAVVLTRLNDLDSHKPYQIRYGDMEKASRFITMEIREL